MLRDVFSSCAARPHRGLYCHLLVAPNKWSPKKNRQPTVKKSLGKKATSKRTTSKRFHIEEQQASYLFPTTRCWEQITHMAFIKLAVQNCSSPVLNLEMAERKTERKKRKAKKKSKLGFPSSKKIWRYNKHSGCTSLNCMLQRWRSVQKSMCTAYLPSVDLTCFTPLHIASITSSVICSY